MKIKINRMFFHYSLPLYIARSILIVYSVAIYKCEKVKLLEIEFKNKCIYILLSHLVICIVWYIFQAFFFSLNESI